LGKALEVNPYDDAVHYQLGRLFFQLQQWTNAIDQLKQAIYLNPKNQDAKDELERVIETKKLKA